MANRLSTLLGLLCLAGASTLHAQKTVSKANTITATATVEAIDYSSRRVTLKNEKGETYLYVVDSCYQAVRFREGRRQGEADVLRVARLPAGQAGPEVERRQRRGGPDPRKRRAARRLIATQEKRTVTVKAVDPAVPSITVTTDDGRTVSRKVEDKKNIEGVKRATRSTSPTPRRS